MKENLTCIYALKYWNRVLSHISIIIYSPVNSTIFETDWRKIGKVYCV